MSGEAWINQGSVTLAGAESKGEFRRIEFRGTTGLQGPYELLSASRNNGELVIAGTERVYLNGRRLARGQNQEYTIDYDAGTVTFTPKVLMTQDSEVAVDFEVTQQRYDRSTLISAAQTELLPGDVDLHLLFARERDDKDSPKNQTFSEEDLQILRDAGDDPAKAVTSGVTPTVPGEGDYVLVPADSITGTDAYFEFSDSTGDYDVSFVDVGRGRGDYELGGISNRGMRYYTYVGPGEGTYLVGRLLPLPESLGLATVRLRRDRGEHLRLDAEWNVSDYDKNLFSTSGDGNNLGAAGNFQLGIQNIPVALGRIGFTGAFNTIEEEFKSFDRARSPYFYRDWNLENVPLFGRETIEEYAAEFARAESAALRYSLSRIDREDVAGTKHEGTIRIGRSEDREIAGRVFDTKTLRLEERRTREHVTARAAFGLLFVRPSATYAEETYLENALVEPDSGFAYRLVRLRLSDRSAQRVNASVELENRDTEEIRAAFQEWTETRRDQTVKAGLAVKGGASLAGELQVTHRRELNYLLRDTRTADLARLTGFARSSRMGLRTDVTYEISQTAARSLVRSFVFVGEGNGKFNDRGDLVGEGQGAFTVVYSPTTKTVPTNSVNFNVRLTWKHTGRRRGLTGRPGTGGDSHGGLFGWIAANVALDQTIAVSEESTLDPAWKVYLMVPRSLQRDETTVFGATTIRQDWTLLDGYPSVSLKFRFERRDEEDNRFEGINEQRFFGQHLVRLSHSMSSLLTLTGEVSREIERRSGAGIDAGSGSVYEVARHSALGGVGFQIAGGSSFDTDLKATLQQDEISGAEQALFTIRPKVTWRVNRMASIFGSYALTRAWDRAETDVRPVVFTNDGDSHRWNVTPTFRLSRYISLIAAYNGRRETVFSGARITDHELKVETRAFF
jgi:hypothetical protein